MLSSAVDAQRGATRWRLTEPVSYFRNCRCRDLMNSIFWISSLLSPQWWKSFSTKASYSLPRFHNEIPTPDPWKHEWRSHSPKGKGWVYRSSNCGRCPLTKMIVIHLRVRVPFECMRFPCLNISSYMEKQLNLFPYKLYDMSKSRVYAFHLRSRNQQFYPAYLKFIPPLRIYES